MRRTLPGPSRPLPTTTAVSDEVRFEPIAPFRLVDSRIGKGTSRLRAGEIVTIDVAGADVKAVSANFVAVDPDGFGYITAYNCTADKPTVSTLNFRPREFVANQAIVPLKNGKMCLFSLVSYRHRHRRQRLLHRRQRRARSIRQLRSACSTPGSPASSV